ILSRLKAVQEYEEIYKLILEETSARLQPRAYVITGMLPKGVLFDLVIGRSSGNFCSHTIGTVSALAEVATRNIAKLPDAISSLYSIRIAALRDMKNGYHMDYEPWLNDKELTRLLTHRLKELKEREQTLDFYMFCKKPMWSEVIDLANKML